MPSLCALGAECFELQLSGCVGVGVDGEQAAEVTCQGEQVVGRVDAFGSRIDLDGGVGVAARRKHLVRIECRLWARTASAGDEPPRAVPEHPYARVFDCSHHPSGHRSRVHLQLRVHRRCDDIDALEHLRGLVERSVVEDVDFDSGQHDQVDVAARVELLDHADLGIETLRRESVGDGQAGRVIGDRKPLLAESACRRSHFADRCTAVAPRGVCVEIAAQRLVEQVA